ncbi:hypothetical protein MKW98_020492 [Papaver atlanticum]|uniref:Uncharacterized protein n=1 Tax=Papaver atlanticum TaxID=357466 RepID=A0AAD4RVP7_9MAGN|nr:hypothetical protein MKW98_020492 [Papaver atlanticum]
MLLSSINSRRIPDKASVRVRFRNYVRTRVRWILNAQIQNIVLCLSRLEGVADTVNWLIQMFFVLQIKLLEI